MPNILFSVFCSMLSYELPKPEPNMFIKMPGRKCLDFGRLEEMAFQIRFWEFLFRALRDTVSASP